MTRADDLRALRDRVLAEADRTAVVASVEDHPENYWLTGRVAGLRWTADELTALIEQEPADGN